MTEYEFKCRRSKKIFTLFMRVTECPSAKIRCPGWREAALAALPGDDGEEE
jgi:hypothetical protein